MVFTAEKIFSAEKGDRKGVCTARFVKTIQTSEQIYISIGTGTGNKEIMEKLKGIFYKSYKAN
jgi:hypothetical protein